MDVPRDGQDKYMLHKLRVIQSIPKRDNHLWLRGRPSCSSRSRTRAVPPDFIRFLTKVPEFIGKGRADPATRIELASR